MPLRPIVRRRQRPDDAGREGSGARVSGDFLSALKAISASNGDRRRLTNKIKASDAADVEARTVPCTCHFDEQEMVGHAQDCDRERAWQRAYDTRLDELEEGR